MSVQSVVEQQADAVIVKVKNNQTIEPITQQIADAARAKAQNLGEEDKKKVISALDALKNTLPNSDPLGNFMQDKAFEDELKTNLKKQLESMNGKLDRMSSQELESALNATENILNIQWIEKIPGMKDKAREILQYQPMLQGIVGATLIQKLQSLGYSFYFTKPNIIKVVSDKSDTIEMETKLNAHLEKSSVLADSIQSGLLYLSPSFRTYRSAVSDPDGKLTNPSTVNIDSYKKYLNAKSSNNLNTSEKVFLQSAQHYGSSFDFQKLLIQSKDLDKVATFVGNNPAIVSQIQQAPSITPAITPTNIPAPVPTLTSTPSTTAGKAAGVVGQGIGTVAGGIGSLVGTVAAETGSTWSTILSEASRTGGAMGTIGVIGLLIGSIWKFGFWKTMMGVVGVGGASAIANAAEDGTLNKLADKMKKGGDKLADAVGKIAGDTSAVVAPAVAAAVATVSETKESIFQKKASDLVRSDDRIKGNINKHLNSSASTQKATLEDYLKFINTDLSGKSLQVLLTPQNSEHSILSPKSSLDPSITFPPNFDSQILKDILRKYFTGTSIPVGGLPDPANQEAVKSAMTKAKGATTLLGAIEKTHA